MTAEVAMDLHTEVANEVSSKQAASMHHDLPNGNSNGEVLDSQVNGDTSDFVILNGEGEEKSVDLAVDGYRENGKVVVDCKPDEEVAVQHGKEESEPVGSDEIVICGSVSEENGVVPPLSIDDQAQDGVFDSVVPVGGDKVMSEQNGSSEGIVCENGVVDCADESLTAEIPLDDNSSSPKVVESGQSVETASFPAADVQSEKDLSDENGDPGHNELPESDQIDDNKPAPEQNGHFDITEASEDAENLLTSPVDEIVQSEKDTSESHASDENGEGLPIGDTHDKIPGSDLADADKSALEENGHAEITTEAEGAENLLIAPVEEMVVPETENGVSVIAQEDIPISADDNESGNEVIKSDLKSVETDDFTQIESEWEVVKSDLENCETAISHSVDFTNEESGNVESESEVLKANIENCETTVSHPVHCTSEKPANEVNGDINGECKVSEAVTEDSQSIPVDDAGEQSDMTDSVQNESHLTACPDAEVKSEPEIDQAPALSQRDMPSDETNDVDVIDVDDTNNECASNPDQNIPSDETIVSEPHNVNVSDTNNGEVGPEIENEPVVSISDTDLVDRAEAETEPENGAVHSASEDMDDKTGQEIETSDASHKEEASTSSPEGIATVDASEKQSVVVVERRPFNFMVKVPRYDDESLKEQIRRAQFGVEEKTESRDAVRVEIQKQRGICKECGDKFDAAISEERAARDLLKSKRKEMDSVQLVINKVKDAMSVEDIDVRLRNLEHMISHETHALKEEKQMIREIKQMKQLREQITSNMADDVQQALDQKDEIQERLKVLRKEADSLRANVLKAEAVTQAAKKKYQEESDNLSKLQAKFRDADDTRQDAYVHLQTVRKQLNDKNKYFWQYKDDFKEANDLLQKGDRDAIQNLCVNQVERFMKLWNEDDEFRKEYIRCNMRSTLRRLRTPDGRSLGPDEKPPVIPSFANPKMARNQTVTPISNSVGGKQEQHAPVEADKRDNKAADKIVEPKKTDKPKKLAKPSANEPVTVDVRADVDDVAREEEVKRIKEEEEAEVKRKKEEEDLARKAEELRKEEEAKKLKERCRLEEKAKAVEALERKKRQAEKAQARAVLRAQKEAEQKEKEREKKLRKKEKRKAGATTTVDINVTNEEETAPMSESIIETPRESEKSTVTKRSKKPSQFTKQQPKASLPPPLRNRGKRRMQTWMWALLAALIVFALFLLGNSSSSFNIGKIF